MKKIHLLYLLFVVSYSYGLQASERDCLNDSLPINAFNNFILYEESISNGSLKEMRVQTKSKDDYLNSDVKVNFDNCGVLLTIEGSKTKKFKNNERVLISASHASVNKRAKGWDYKFSFNMSMIDEEGVEKDILQQQAKGVYLTDDGGKINKTVGTFNIVVGNEKTKGKSVTTYAFNKDGKLSESKQLGTLETDNSTKKYFYDLNGRLIKTQTESTIEEFSYDETGRELSIKSVAELFTTETNVTTCKSWNELGRCTKAEINTSTLFKGDNGQKDVTRKNHAEVTFDLIY